MGARDANTPPIVSLIIGGLAGSIEAGVTYPSEFVKTRVQLYSELGIKSLRNPFKIVSQVYKQEELRAFYKGSST